jgi:hypothetical protein
MILEQRQFHTIWVPAFAGMSGIVGSNAGLAAP